MCVFRVQLFIKLSCLALPNTIGFNSAKRAASVAQLVEHPSRTRDVAVQIPAKAAEFTSYFWLL